MKLTIPTRYYRTIPMSAAGYVEEEAILDPDRTALVVMHCWNIGCPDGRPVDDNFCVGLGMPETVDEGGRIIKEVIRPAMDAARRAGVLVVHVESEVIGRQYPEVQHDLDPPSEPPAPVEQPGPAVPGWRSRICARSHGERYWENPPYHGMDRTSAAAPLPGEPFVFETRQMHRQLARRGIENLLYTGFATDMCILRAPGGVEPMAPFDYRLFILRDATLGIEFPDTFAERLATRWGLRYFETHYGNTLLAGDFITACNQKAASGKEDEHENQGSGNVP